MKELSKEILNTYDLWRTDERFDKDTRDELNKPMSNEEIEDRFWRDLEFGTGGLRGVMGAGTNRMNKYIIRKNHFFFVNVLILLLRVVTCSLFGYIFMDSLD